MRFEDEIALEQQRFVVRYDEAVRVLRRVPGVLSVGVGARERRGELMPELVFRVYVAQKIAESELPDGYRVPRLVCGLPTDVIQKPEVEELQSSSSSAFVPNWDSTKYRPLQGGCQIRSEKFEGDNKRGMGTLGCLAQMADGTLVGLTAQHVACAGTEYNVGAGSSASAGATAFACVGTKVGQPRHVTCCCCCTFNEIGAVLRAHKSAQLDCATVKLDDDTANEVRTAGTVNQVVDIGAVTGVAQAVCFSEVRKRGAATRLTRGTVVDVLYEGSQILINPLPGFAKFAHFGDSGAVIVDNAGKVVGLLWGADRSTRNRGVANHIGPVLAATGITIAGDAGAGLAIPTNNCGSSAPGPSSTSSSSSSSSSGSSSSSSSSSSSTSSSSSGSSSSSASSSSSSSSSSALSCPTITLTVDASDTLTHKIPSKLGAPGKDHFVTVKGAGKITLQATIVPNTAALRSALTWEAVGGAIVSPVGGDRLKAEISRGGASGKKVRVRIRVGTTVCREFFVWIVWSTLAADIDATHTSFIDATPLGLHGGRSPGSYQRAGGIDWTATIEPATIITDADRPAIEGQARQAPPGDNAGVPGPGNLDATGSGFSGWDISRQKRRKVFKGNPPGTPVAETTGADPDPVDRPLGLPANDVEGNDDGSCGADEDSNPYDAGAGVPGKGTRGTLRANDEPTYTFPDASGANGDVFRKRIHFREFVRVQLGTTWYRCSDFGLWRWHVTAKRVAGSWNAEPGQADVLDLTNTGF